VAGAAKRGDRVGEERNEKKELGSSPLEERGKCWDMKRSSSSRTENGPKQKAPFYSLLRKLGERVIENKKNHC